MKITGSGSGGENQAISSAWNEMLGEADERLCQLLAQKVVGTTGREPQMQEVRAFLKSLHVEVSPADTKEAEPRVKSGWYSINGGHRIRSRGAINVVKGALNALADAIPNFMEIYEVKSREYIDARQKTHRYWIADDPRRYTSIQKSITKEPPTLCVLAGG
jgi:hypothetical protein